MMLNFLAMTSLLSDGCCQSANRLVYGDVTAYDWIPVVMMRMGANRSMNRVNAIMNRSCVLVRCQYDLSVMLGLRRRSTLGYLIGLSKWFLVGLILV